MSRSIHRVGLVSILSLWTCVATAAEPLDTASPSSAYRLRADALGQAQSPTGVISLEGVADPTPWARVEASLWGGAKELENTAALLVGALHLRAPGGWGELSLGRMIVGPGAIRPLHLDGGKLSLRLPSHTEFQAFGGWTVATDLSEEDHDWAVGGRVAQTWVDLGTLGVSWMQRREHGQLDDHEVGADLLIAPSADWDLSGRVAWDLVNPGFAEAIAAFRLKPGRDWRVELEGVHRSASRILPATSLFSVLGDLPSQRGVGRLRWTAAPRLSFELEGGARRYEDALGETARLRGVLKLDRVGASHLSAELRREGGPAEVAHSGARVTLRVQLTPAWSMATELEIVRPDSGEDASATTQTLYGLTRAPSRGTWWPWGLVASELRLGEAWLLAAALEASSSASREWNLDALARLSWFWENES